jgi:hypothetical protein
MLRSVHQVSDEIRVPSPRLPQCRNSCTELKIQVFARNFRSAIVCSTLAAYANLGFNLSVLKTREGFVADARQQQPALLNLADAQKVPTLTNLPANLRIQLHIGELAESLCIRRATISLPHPASPKMSTLALIDFIDLIFRPMANFLSVGEKTAKGWQRQLPPANPRPKRTVYF